MKTIPSPLILEDYYFTDFIINTIVCEADKKQKVVDDLRTALYDVDFDITQVEGDERFLIQVDVNNIETYKDQDNTPGYRFGVRVVGVLKVGKIDGETARVKSAEIDLIMNSGVTLLINLVRSMVALITAKSYFGPLQLPLIDFKDLVAKWIISRNAQTNEAAARQPSEND